MSRAVRRRRLEKEEEGLLTESLLQPEEAAPLEQADASRPGTRDIIPYSGSFNLQDFLLYVFQSWLGLIGAFFSRLPGFKRGSAHQEQAFSPEELRVLGELRVLAQTPFDGSNAAHQDDLRRLWQLSGIGAGAAPQLKSPQWKELGFQNSDPSSDFRGAGHQGLLCLLYLAELQQSTFRRLAHKQDGTRSALEYPFAAAGINLTHGLQDILQLHGPAGASSAAAASSSSSSGASRLAAQRGFLQLLLQEERAFEAVYCMAFELLDATWLAMRASYMEFNAVLKATRARLERELAAQPGSLEQLRARLLRQ